MDDLFSICVALHQSYETNPVACESRKQPPRPWERFAKRPERRELSGCFHSVAGYEPRERSLVEIRKILIFFITKTLFAQMKFSQGKNC